MKCMHSRPIIVASIFFALACPLVTPAATIHSETSASADSGGNVVGSGGRVMTGSASASASVYTNISGDSSGGTVDISVTTERNGDVQTEERHIDVPAGTSVSVSVATSSVSTGTSSNVTPIPVPQASSIVENVKHIVERAVGQLQAVAPAPPSQAALIQEEIVGGSSTVLAVNGDADAALSTGNWLLRAYVNVRTFISSIFSIFSL